MEIRDVQGLIRKGSREPWEASAGVQGGPGTQKKFWGRPQTSFRMVSYRKHGVYLTSSPQLLYELPLISTTCPLPFFPETYYFRAAQLGLVGEGWRRLENVEGCWRRLKKVGAC